MLEKYAAHVLDHYIGKYVQNFNPDNLSIGILQGAVELEDLLLRSDALKEFDFPGLQLLWGCIGKITLNIPSYKNYNEPWVIDIHKLFLLLTPNTNSEESNEQAETQARIDFKYKQLTAREEKWNATHSSNRSIYSIWQSYSSSIATKILQNLQVRVHDVHIRYEDSTTCSSPFAFGMCIDVLSIQSTNQNWKSNSSNLNNGDKKFKLVHLSNMSIYWDTKAVCFGGDLQDIKNQMMQYKDNLPNTTKAESTTSSYVVNPVSSEARFTQDLSQWRLLSPSNPRLTFSMELPLVSLKLNKRQYNQMLQLGEEVTRWTIRHRNKSGRPIENVRNNPQEWWRWAMQHHLSKIREKRRRGSWEFICRRLKMLLKYVANYRQLLKMKYVLKTQDADVSAAVCEVEEELTLDELLLLREVVYDQLNQEILAKRSNKLAKQNERRRSLGKGAKSEGRGWGWTGWLGNWGQSNEKLKTDIQEDMDNTGDDFDSNEEKSPASDAQKSVYQELDDKELYEIFGEGFSEKETNESFLHRDTVFLKLNFNLCNGSISLYDDSGGDCAGVVSLEFNNLKLGSDLKPRTGTYNMRIDLENILLKDLNKSNSHYSNLVQLSDRTKLSTNTDNTRIKVKKEQSVPSVFCLFYEKLPRAEQESFSDSLQVATDPLCITCVPGLMDRLKHFFTSQDHGDETDYLMSNYDSDLLSGLARKKYATWKLQTQQEISNAVKRIMQGKSVNTKKMRRWKVVLDICAPEIIIPQDISDPKGKTVIFNLGHVNVASHLEASPDSDDEKVVECSTPDNDSDDDFRTPLNSPPPEYSTFIDPAKSQPPTPGHQSTTPSNGKHEVLSETMMLDKMYERFHISFSNLQVLVASNNLEWSGTQFGGSSRFHFIQPFSLNLQIDRRVVSTLDPMYPALKVSGKLPHLTLHISHLKVRTVEWCIKQFQTEISASNPPSEGEVGGKEADLWMPGSFRDDPDHAKSVQLSCDFLINQVSVVLEEDMDNRFISVLEVNRVQTIFTKRPFDDSTELSIYSLLLVDVMQQLGKDFELLLASHRSVCLDMDSGEILDSGATSPIPSSHQLSPNLSRAAEKLGQAERILNNIGVATDTYRDGHCSFDARDASEYLINVHLQTHQYGSPHMVPTTTKRKTTVDAKFSNLDAVFNVKSWTKILSFLHNLIASDQPKQESWASNLINTKKKETIKSRAMKVVPGVTRLELLNELNDSEIHINFDFNKLNVLFLRHIYTQSKIVGRKVATATLQSAQIVGDIIKEKESKESSNITVRGSVASLQVQDLTMVNQWGTRNLGSEIVNVGFVDSQRNETLFHEKYQIDVKNSKLIKHSRKAFLFDFFYGKASGDVRQKSDATDTTTSQSEKGLQSRSCNAVATETHSFSYLQLPEDSAHEQTEQESKVSLELALICYIHSPRLVQEVLALTDEVNEVVGKQMTTATRQAYKDMARSIIEKVSDYSKTILGQGEDTRSEEQMNEPHKPRKPGSRLDFVMKLRSPLIAFPKFAESYELVVANLGEITVSNNPDIDSSQSPMDRLRISIVNMNLRTHRQIEAEIENKKSGSISIGPNILMLKKSCLVDLSTTSSHTSGETSDYEILHNTSLELKVDKVGYSPGVRKRLDRRSCCGAASDEMLEQFDNTSPCCTEYASCMGGISDKQMCMEIHTESTTTFSLSKGTYEQILKTLDNISFGGDIDEIPTTHTQPKHSVSAPDVAFVSKLPPERRATQPNLQGKYDEGLLFEPSSSEDMSENLVSNQTRKYTPLKVNFRVPCLLFQLDGDLGDGQQGIVKVTIHDFEAAYDKENRFGTSFDLSLGSLDIQDLLQPEGSLNRYIVTSSRSSRLPPPPNYLSISCPDVPTHPLISDTKLSTSLPAMEDSLHFPLHSMTGTDKEDTTVDHSNIANTTHNNTLVHITAFLVDGKSVAYQKVYNRTNRNIDIDFNSLDCKVNLQTWVVLLDFFGIGTSPKKTFQIDQETEQEFPDLTQLDVKSYYENQPEDHINSDIDFTVRHFSIMLVKPEYELLKADVTNLQLHAQLKDGRMRVNGQLGGLAVSDLTPNGFLYKERFIFTGDKALDFDVIKYDDFDYKLERAYDISVKLRMASIRYVHTQRFQNETVAFCQHFQQLQEILGRMRAASVGQSVCVAARRQGRIALDIQTGPAIILIPESCHAQRLIVANLGRIIVKNEFLRNGESGTLSSYRNAMNNENTGIPDVSTLFVAEDYQQVVGPSTGMKSCVLDVIHVTLVDMNLFAAVHTEHQQGTPEEQDTLLFPSYSVVLDQQPLLTKKVQLKLQLERNLEKEITHRGVPDTALSVELSSVVCKLDHTQYWLIRGVLDHNIGEAIPDFPQPTAFLQPSELQTVLTGDVYTEQSMDFTLTNVSIELLDKHAQQDQPAKSMGRLEFVKSVLQYRSLSNNIKTTNLSCEAFRAHDTWSSSQGIPPTFTIVLGPTNSNKTNEKGEATTLQFELFQRAGPDFVEFTALLNSMRVVVILDWLISMNKYILDNPDQDRFIALKGKTAKLMAKYGQQDSGNQQALDNSGELNQAPRRLDIRLSITNTEFVMFESMESIETDAVILRSTAVVNFSPHASSPQRNNLPLSCSLQSLEVFSCQLNKQVETALSIIDPVTINVEVRGVKKSDLRHSESIDSHGNSNILDVQLSEVSMRLSYNDVMLILAIFKSLPPQTSKNESSTASTEQPGLQYIQASVGSLTELGFAHADATHALSINGGNEELAAAWLMEHATLQPVQEKQGKLVPLNISRVCCAIGRARVCLIDDCDYDCDVPLAEFALSNLVLRQALSPIYHHQLVDTLHGRSASASFTLNGEYYNRMLSLWEPFLDPWRCKVDWEHEGTSSGWVVKVEASDRFDVSVTTTLIETIEKTRLSWMKHYEAFTAKSRKPFIPYIIKNLTGCQLSFALQSQTWQGNNHGTRGSDDRDWKMLEAGEQCSFQFATIHVKQRHKRSPLLKHHQIIVKVGNWKELDPVTVSRVGIFFRHAIQEISKSSTVYQESVPVRVVFNVALEGSAQKVITVRSALVVQSKVKIPIQLQLEGNDQVGVHTLPRIMPGETQFIPLPLTSCSMRVRPVLKAQFNYSNESVIWTPVTQDSPQQSTKLQCEPKGPSSPFHFAVCIQRQEYPADEQVYENLFLEEEFPSDVQRRPLPAHLITILPTITISNLLPCDLYYYVKNTNVEGTLKPGMEATPPSIDVQDSTILGCLIENFQNCRELVIPANVKNFQMRMLMKDHNNETLILNVRILWRFDCSVRVSIMAGYWIVNKTGLPIVLKQEGTTPLAAGQHEAHEEARSLQPLIFSYANRDQPYLCTMRVGKKAQIGGLSAGPPPVPLFCQKFSTDGGSCTRNLRMIASDGTPNREFCMGISVRRGWGRFMHTHIVTIAPRFLLLNNTKANRLSFAQRHTVSSTASTDHLTIIPGSSVVFHWPRVDRDTLLCVRLTDEPMTRWSGGFFIDRTDAFHVSLRLAHPAAILHQNATHPLASHCIFLNVEVTLKKATYVVCVSDADPSLLPPPLRVDNISAAAVCFTQYGTKENTEVPAESQLAYACDEPCLPPRLLCWVNGSTSQVIVDMNDLDSEKQIYYDNYIYISVGSSGPSTGTLNDRILVLDVMHDARHLELQPLQPGKRSQLWRMRSDGRLFHEGTAPPRKSTEAASSSHDDHCFVLDISELAIKHDLGEGIPLSLKRRDARRSSTQTWEFKQEGRMCCMHRNLCVQAKELKAGSIVVLASYPEGRVCLRNELCMRHKHIPGSGVLSLKVVRDGPTRVLRVVDIRQKRAGVLVSHRPDWTVLQSHIPNHTKLRVTVAMSKGLGVSLVSNHPEELVYITMNGVTMEFNAAHGEKSYIIKMQKVQIDNQLMQSRFPVVLSSRQSSSSSTDPLFSLHVVTQPSSSRTYEIYKSLSMDIGRTSLNLEEELLLKLVRFAGGGKTTSERDSQLLDETKIPVDANPNTEATSAHRYYFEAIKLSMMPTHLSVYTASRLQPDLKAIKQSLSLTLVQFERAPVDLKPYTRNHLFETISFVIGDMTKFIREQMMGQAAMILGSVDFLGNPIGLLTDVKAGVSGLARGNLPNMLKHFSHGLSNSTALMTSSLSKGLGGLTMDEDYDEKRRLIQLDARDAGGHMVAGVQGLMAGMIGGLTGMITQPVKGAQEDGTKGLLKGIVKGVVGTVTKPVTGVLDLASESASAVREISLTKEQITHRVRRIRCCHSFQGCLQSYSESSAEGQQFLYSLNNRDYSEHYYSRAVLSFQTNEDVIVLITSKSVYFILGSDPDPERIMLLVDYNNLVKVQVLRPTSASGVGSSHAEQTTLELTTKLKPGHGRRTTKKPQIICHSRNLAERVCQQINYAKTLFTEHTETLCYGATRDGHADRAFEIDV